MVNFTRLNRELASRQELECPECGNQFQAYAGETICSKCAYYREHPEHAPGYFTWRRSAGRWIAQARWPEGKPPPAPGLTIDVRRKDGSSKRMNVVACEYHGCDPYGDVIVRCTVSPAGNLSPGKKSWPERKPPTRCKPPNNRSP